MFQYFSLYLIIKKIGRLKEKERDKRRRGEERNGEREWCFVVDS